MAAAPDIEACDPDLPVEPAPLSVPVTLGFDTPVADPRERWLREHGWSTVATATAWVHDRAPGVTFTLAEATMNQLVVGRAAAA